MEMILNRLLLHLHVALWRKSNLFFFSIAQPNGEVVVVLVVIVETANPTEVNPGTIVELTYHMNPHISLVLPIIHEMLLLLTRVNHLSILPTVIYVLLLGTTRVRRSALILQ